MSDASDQRWMRLALTLASRGLGRVWPNPAVGCVIVREGRVVGRGWTQPGGRPHAETVALAQAGADARGATVYVTLEPCAHHGRTPPCADALVAAGVARVVVAMGDPDPRVNGRGLDWLGAAGIKVDAGECGREQAEELQKGFLMRLHRGRPMLSLKLAGSVDGRIATRSGESRWITGPVARRRVHGLRAVHDAVMVGGGTARADDPMLNLRDLGMDHQPLRIVCASALDLPEGGRLFESAGKLPLWLCHGPDAPAAARRRWEDAGARLLQLPPGRRGGIDPEVLLQRLGEEGLTRVLCEGGGQFAAALLRADLVDDLHQMTAGLLLGEDARPALGALEIDRLAQAPRWDLVRAERLGADVWCHWRRPRT